MSVILIVDDEPLQREILKTILDAEGFETYSVGSAKEALDAAVKIRPDVMLTDLKMDGMDGMELLEAVSKEQGAPTTILMTAHGTISSAVEAVRKGAFDYLTKPLDKDKLVLTIKRAMERAELLNDNRKMRQELYGRFRIEGIVGKSEKMRLAMDMVRKVADSSATVCITGESGTGKELIARAIHYNSARRAKPFTALNCSAIPENLFESELFGHEAGAFTGATARKEGLFELSNGGTLLLDEIAELPIQMQSKLLRVLQEKEIRRVGGKQNIKIDVRVIAATNKDLEKEVASGAFREDLYYRLSVLKINLPPLRERIEDLQELVEYLLSKFNAEYGKRISGVDADAMKAFVQFRWPGNIRQLASVMERAVLINETGSIGMRDIQGELNASGAINIAKASAIDIPDEGLNFEELEKELIEKAMIKSGGMATKAAKLLGMSYKTFLYRLEKFNPKSQPEK